MFEWYWLDMEGQAERRVHCTVDPLLLCQAVLKSYGSDNLAGGLLSEVNCAPAMCTGGYLYATSAVERQLPTVFMESAVDTSKKLQLCCPSHVIVSDILSGSIT
jgi:hypothetical protein